MGIFQKSQMYAYILGFTYLVRKFTSIDVPENINIVKYLNGRRSQMANGNLGLGPNVQLGLLDFKVCDWPPETSLNGQSQTLKSCWAYFKILLAN